MFIALEAAEPKSGGIFGGVLNILKKPKPYLEARHASGAAYGVILTPVPVRKNDWGRIAMLAGRNGDRLLLPAGLIPPEPLRAAGFPRYERMVLLKTACEIIKRTRMPMYRRIAGLIDENGEYADFLYPLLKHFTSVKVLTRNTAFYSTQAERMMEELGAPVMLCDSDGSLSDCVLIIAPNAPPFSKRPVCPALALKPPERESVCDYITGLRVIPDAGHAALCPKDIDAHDFFAALYEYCGVDAIDAAAGKMLWHGREATLGEVVRAVMQAAGTLSIF